MSTSHDRDGLLAAIRAAPDDDVPRLVYADWLDEHGGASEQARAGFIRLQVESERLKRQSDDVGCPQPDGVAAMEKEANRLLMANKAAFLAGLPLGNGFAVYFRRGMLEDAVARTARDFVNRSAAAFAAAPIRSLRFSRIAPDDVPAVLATGHLRRVEALTLTAATADGAVLPEVVARFGQSGDVGGVRRLCVRTPYVAPMDVDALVRSLAASGRWSSLTALALHVCGSLSAETMRDLGRTKGIPGLQELDLTAHDVSPSPTLSLEARVALTTCFPELRVLRMQGAQLDDTAATSFARSKQLGRLRRLDAVDGCHAMTDPDALMGLLTSETLAEMTSLKLTGPPVNPRLAMAKRPKRPRPPTLRSLSWHRSDLGDADVQVLASRPTLRGLTSLDLVTSMIGPDGARALAAVGWERLSWLRLWANRLGDRGAEMLASSPSLAGLTYLDLYANEIGPDGARALADSPHLGGLRFLNLGANPCDAKALRPLKKRFGAKGWRDGQFRRPD